MKSRQVGRIGERKAEEFLKKKGYKILERNWGNKWGEIDIICKVKTKSEEVIVFVEVKTKTGDAFGFPEEMVNKKKLAQIQKISSGYELARDSLKRIDVVAVILDRNYKNVRLDHFKGVY